MLPPHQLGLAGPHQQVNASLAVQLAATWEQAAGPSCGGPAAAEAAQRAQQLAQLQLPDAYVEGLRGCVWPGRAQVRHHLGFILKSRVQCSIPCQRSGHFLCAHLLHKCCLLYHATHALNDVAGWLNSQVYLRQSVRAPHGVRSDALQTGHCIACRASCCVAD